MSVLVVGYDASDGANAALEEALRLAPQLGAGLLLVYGAHVPRAGGEVADLVATLREAATAVLAQGEAFAQAAGVPVRTELAEGRIAEELADIAMRERAAMILVGSTGERPLRGLLVGSTPYRLLHLASTPVLVVRA